MSHIPDEGDISQVIADTCDWVVPQHVTSHVQGVSAQGYILRGNFEVCFTRMRHGIRIWMSRVIYCGVVWWERVAQGFVTCCCWGVRWEYENASRHMCMGHVTYEWGTSHMTESYHVWLSNVTREWVMSLRNKSCLWWLSHVLKGEVGSLMNEACMAYGF